MTNEIIDSVDINLPPGVLTKMAQKEGLMDKVNEMALLDIINRRLAPKFREMICQQQSLQDEQQKEAGQIVEKSLLENTSKEDGSLGIAQ